MAVGLHLQVHCLQKNQKSPKNSDRPEMDPEDYLEFHVNHDYQCFLMRQGEH